MRYTQAGELGFRDLGTSMTVISLAGDIVIGDLQRIEAFIPIKGKINYMTDEGTVASATCPVAVSLWVGNKSFTVPSSRSITLNPKAV